MFTKHDHFCIGIKNVLIIFHCFQHLDLKVTVLDRVVTSNVELNIVETNLCTLIRAGANFCTSCVPTGDSYKHVYFLHLRI